MLTVVKFRRPDQQNAVYDAETRWSGNPAEQKSVVESWFLTKIDINKGKWHLPKSINILLLHQWQNTQWKDQIEEEHQEKLRQKEKKYWNMRKESGNVPVVPTRGGESGYTLVLHDDSSIILTTKS